MVENLASLLSNKAHAGKILGNVKVKNSEKNCVSSVVKMLLTIEELQGKIVGTIINQLRNLALSNEEENVIYFNLIMQQLSDFRNLSCRNDLISKIIDLFSNSSGPMREQSIKMVELIIPRSKQSNVVAKLLELTTNNEDIFTQTNIDTFMKLHLDDNILKRLRLNLIDFLKGEAQKNMTPHIIKFILYSSVFIEKAKAIDAFENLRHIVNWNMKQSVIIEIFDYISSYFKRYKILRRYWVMAIIRYDIYKKQHLIDLVILIVLKDIDKSAKMDLIYKERILNHCFDVPLLKSCFESLGYIIRNFLISCLDLFEYLFKDKNVLVSNFGAEGFKLLLNLKDSSYEKEIVLSRLVGIASAKTNHRPSQIPCFDLRTRTLVLLGNIKTQFNETKCAYYHVEKMLDHSLHFSVMQIRMTMDILYSLAHQQAHQEIIILKQITNTMNSKERYHGIIALVRMLNFKMWETQMTELSPMGVDNSLNSISQIPTSTGKQLGKLLSVAFQSVAHDFTGLCLLYDELAAIFSPKNNQLIESVIDNGFLLWLSDFVQSEFQNSFIVDNCPNTTKGFSLKYFDCINQPEENQNDEEGVMTVAVNLCSYLNTNKIQTIYAHFNLLQNLILRRYDCDLQPIDALLGCALVLPKHFDDPEKLMEEHAKFALDIYFYSVNWYRQVISAFVNSSRPSIRKKVLIRLLRLIELEFKLKNLLKKIKGNYKPPPCSFQDYSKKLTKSSKKKKICRKLLHAQCTIFDKNTNIYPKSKKMISNDTNQANVQPILQSFDFSYGSLEIFRELDSNLMLLLKEDFKIMFPIPENEKGNGIHLLELR